MGAYGFSSEGLVIPAPGVTLPYPGVGRTNFDGRGNFVFLEHTVVNVTFNESFVRGEACPPRQRRTHAVGVEEGLCRRIAQTAVRASASKAPRV
jgi:hypothetical protein